MKNILKISKKNLKKTNKNNNDHLFHFKNRSFEDQLINESNEISFDFDINKEKNMNTLIRRKSCHCKWCGNLTKFQEKHIFLPANIRFHKILLERESNLKKHHGLRVSDIVSLKRNSFMKYFPKKASLCIFYFRHLYLYIIM